MMTQDLAARPIGATQNSLVEIGRMAATIAGVAQQGSDVQMRVGQIHYDTTNLVFYVTSGGQPVNAVWNQALVPYDGANCVLLLASQGNNVGTYFVAFITDSVPNPGITAKVTAFTAGQPTCTVKIGNTSYTAQRAASYTPTVGDVAIVFFAAGTAYAVAPLSVYTPPLTTLPAATQPPPGKSGSGNSLITCQDSGTWTDTYNWNSYFGQNTYSGSGYVPRSTGSWFYNGGTLGLADKTTINAIRFFLGPRRNGGAYNSAATVHFYTHNAVSRGAGEPTRIDGPFDVSIPAGWGGDWVALPGSFAATLKAGGGISIAGDPYVGFTGVGENGNAGALSIDWSK